MHIGLALFVTLLPAISAQSSFSPHLLAEEQVEGAPDVEIAVLEAALRFYAPPGGQSRWLDAERLPAQPGAPAPRVAAATARELVQRLGAGRFCTTDTRDRCRARRGGALRVSPVYRAGDRARVAVRFESAQPYAPAVTSTQVFVLERRGERWQIAERGPAAGSVP